MQIAVKIKVLSIRLPEVLNKSVTLLEAFTCTLINAGQVTFPDLGGVLSITIVPVAFGVTNPTEFSAQTLIIFGLPLCKSMYNFLLQIVHQF